MLNYRHKLNTKQIDLGLLAKRLNEKREFLIKLLENPVLLDNESFSTLLRAMFRLIASQRKHEYYRMHSSFPT